MAFYPLKNKIQHYAWGSRTAIAELTNRPFPTETPEAEMWMGTHTKGESEVNINGRWVPLSKLINDDPAGVLGDDSERRFSKNLPFLFKVLASEQPLSVQAHPDKEKAAAGFFRENALNLPRDDPGRNYRDGNHKPELICALRPFTALSGFRPVHEIIDAIGKYCPGTLPRELELLRKSPHKNGLRRFFQSIMTLPHDQRKACIDEALRFCDPAGERELEETWMKTLFEKYPYDIGILSPLLLNLSVLKPGQALFLSAGELHAYLYGLGIELMANSDNVIRGGLTPKHMDVDELMNILDFEGRETGVIEPEAVDAFESVYPTPASEFQLSAISLDNSGISRNCSKSPEILLCVEGRALLFNEHNSIHIEKGDSVFVSAGAHEYRLEGKAAIFRAKIPDAEKGTGSRGQVSGGRLEPEL